MINELLFLLHIVVTSSFILAALYLGKDALVATVSVLFVLANMFVIKQVTLFGFDVTSTDVYVVGSMFGFNLLQEFFGEAETKKAVWVSVFILFLSFIMVKAHLLYIPNMYDITHAHFIAVLTPMKRIMLASLFVALLAQYIRIFIHGLFLKAWGDRLFVTRNMLVLFFSQFIDTILFAFIGLYGLVHDVFSIILISLLIKTIVILCSAPLVVLSKKVMGR